MNKNEIQIQKKNEMVSEYLDLIRCTFPYCICGKCILKKNREHSLPNFNYDKNIKSMYKNQYIWKNPEKLTLSNGAKINRLDGLFKQNFKNGMESIMKKDFKLIQTEPTEYFSKKKNKIENNLPSPFLSTTSYGSWYPDWKTSIKLKSTPIIQLTLNIPFSGKSSYNDTYRQIEKQYYIDRPLPILKKDNIEVGGNFNRETTSKSNYKPIDLKKSKDLNNLKLNSSIFSGFMLAAPYIKDSFISSYERAFMCNDFKNSK